jgi:uncharacterized protein with PQ loop repeat
MNLFLFLLSWAGLGLVLLTLAVLVWQYTEFRRDRLGRVLFSIRLDRLAFLFFLLLGILGADYLGKLLVIKPFAIANAISTIVSVLMIFGLIILVQNIFLVQNMMDDKNGKKGEN